MSDQPNCRKSGYMILKSSAEGRQRRCRRNLRWQTVPHQRASKRMQHWDRKTTGHKTHYTHKKLKKQRLPTRAVIRKLYYLRKAVPNSAFK